jgi:gliding motility associated protien GldN
MKKAMIFFMGLCIILGSLAVYGQDNVTEVYVKEHIPSKKPVPYPYIREADVMWAKIIWRMIDLREKQNFPLYYPLQPIDTRMNLITLILSGIDNEGLMAYSPDDPLNEFKQPLTKEAIDFNMGAKTDTLKIADPTTGQITPKIVNYGRRTEDVKEVLLKEKWFFDKQHSTMQVRIIGICPIRFENRTDDQGNPTGDMKKIQCFWVYYPAARNIFANHEVYNRFNDAQHISFDDLFFQRRFNSFIYAESNVQNNRRIQEYSSGIETLYESERIKESIFNMEHDLWEY